MKDQPFIHHAKLFHQYPPHGTQQKWFVHPSYFEKLNKRRDFDILILLIKSDFSNLVIMIEIQIMSLEFLFLFFLKSHDIMEFVNFCITHFLQSRSNFFYIEYEKWHFLRSKYTSNHHFSNYIIRKDFSLRCCIKAIISWDNPIIWKDLLVFVIYNVPMIDIMGFMVKKSLRKCRYWLW